MYFHLVLRELKITANGMQKGIICFFGVFICHDMKVFVSLMNGHTKRVNFRYLFLAMSCGGPKISQVAMGGMSNRWVVEAIKAQDWFEERAEQVRRGRGAGGGLRGGSRVLVEGAWRRGGWGRAGRGILMPWMTVIV